MKRRMSLFFFAPVALLSLGAFAQQGPDISKLRFWVEPAEAVRGPDHYGEDNIFTSWEKSRGHFIGYTANACWHSEGNCTAAVEGLSPGDAGAPPVSPQYHKDIISNDGLTVPAWGRCGQWLNSVLSRNGKLYAFVHGENPAAGDTTCSHYSTHHKTMALWTSSDGLAWHDPVEIIDAPGGRPNGESGEGDCTAIAADGFAYLFCRRTSDTNSGVARKPLAELADPRVGFVKYNHDWGEESGLHGMDSPLPGTMAGTGASTNRLGSSASVWKDRGWVMLLNVEDIAFGGLKVSFTTLPNLRSNAITFTTLPEPLFVEEPDTATGSYPYETHPTRNLYIYPSALNPADATRSWNTGGGFLLVYTFVPHHNNLDWQRLLIMRKVRVTTSAAPQDPQVLVALTTRYDPQFHQRYSSTQPVAFGDPSGDPEAYAPGSFAQGETEPVAYLAQKPESQGQRLTKLVECRSSDHPPFPAAGHPDHLIAAGTCDPEYDEDTVAGYAFPKPPAAGRSVEIFRCRNNSNRTHWVSRRRSCDGIGTMEGALGWGLLHDGGTASLR